MILSIEKQMTARRLGPREIAVLCDGPERKLNEALAVARGDEIALTWMARARALRGDLEGALRHLDDAAARDHLRAFFERGRLLVRKYRRPRGLPQLLAREDRPLFTDPAPDSPQAELYRQMARVDLRRVRSQGRERGMLLYSEAALDFLDLRFAEAGEKIGAYLKDFGADADALALRALANLYQGRPDRALPDLDLARDYLPADGFMADWRAIVKYLVGDAEGALRDLSREGAEAGTLCLRGTLLHVRGEFEASHADYRKATEISPLWADAYAGRAAAAGALGRLEEADRDYGRAIELEPREASLHENRGLLRLRAGRKKEAEADLRRAIELSPSRRERLGPSLDACRE
jgi:Flp pilus assembly protein TadD